MFKFDVRTSAISTHDIFFSFGLITFIVMRRHMDTEDIRFFLVGCHEDFHVPKSKQHFMLVYGTSIFYVL